MSQEKAQFNTAIYCANCSIPLYLANTHCISVVREVKPINLCNKCFVELTNEHHKVSESPRTYHIIAEIKNNYRCVVEANSPTEALAKFNEGKFIDFDFLDSEPLVAAEVTLAPE